MTDSEMPPSVDELLRQGIEAAHAGDRPMARTLLEQVVARDESNERAWFWLAAVAETVEEKRACLEKVIAINPLNDRAQRLLEQLEGRATPAASPPLAAAEQAEAEPRTLNRALIIGVLAVLGLAIVVALLLNRGGEPSPEPTSPPPPEVGGVEAVPPTQAAGEQAGEQPAPAETSTPSGPTRTPVPTWTPAPSATLPLSGRATPLAPPPTGLSGRIALRSGLVLGDERLQPIVLMSPDGSQSRTVSEGGERGTAPALSPGSSYLAYVEVTSTREQLIKVLSLSRPGAPWFWGGTPRLDRQDMPTWSPDGNWIAFTASSFADQLPDLYRVTGFASGEPILERLTQDNAIESWPSFSPDGARIVYAVDLSPSGGATELRVMEIASRQASNLTGNGATLIESSPDWSPVPERPYIVFQGQEAGSAQSDLYWVPADGSAPPEKLFESEASEIHPRFSPDGRFILFSSDRTGNWDVFIYEIASGEIFQVTTADTVEIATDWAP